MRYRGRVHLANKIVKHLNNWQQLGCQAWRVRSLVGVKYAARLVFGISSEGKAMILYPKLKANESVPFSVCQLMLEAESRGAIAGCVENIGDAWDLAYDDEEEYPRKRRTFAHQYWFNKHQKERKNGKAAPAKDEE